ncbi:MAG: 3-oxoacyl-[acyl-carrier-protein] synthase [Candidatus Eremiobacteraeota bacterium]|nr:3-oxoacyl-[acyl-carrier-protein] synthase [Candidatus Eremiobacteraeota bacterium]
MSVAEARRVAITGLGVVTALGAHVETFWANVCAGRSGVSAIERFDASELPVRIAAEIKDFDSTPFIAPQAARTMDLFSQYALVASLLACRDAGFVDDDSIAGERTGVVVGSGTGGYATMEREAAAFRAGGLRDLNPYYVPTFLVNMASAQVAMRLGIGGPSLTTATACAAGANAIGEAFRMIRRGEVDVALGGGTEAPIHPLSLAGFCAMRALAPLNDAPAEASRPFDRGRKGFVLGEGAGMVVLEEYERARARGARIYAELVGYGATTDAFHLTMPRPDGRGAIACMTRALADGGLAPGEVDYVNAHGTATKLGDVSETRAIKAVFGARASTLPCSSTKSMTGHLLGAAGAVEAIVTALAVERDVVPPTINLDHPDPECDLDYVPGTARSVPVGVALSNSFAFGGHNACLVLRKAEAYA